MNDNNGGLNITCCGTTSLGSHESEESWKSSSTTKVDYTNAPAYVSHFVKVTLSVLTGNYE